jgi:N-acylglucosamine-6-phosphate 2-epimerase
MSGYTPDSPQQRAPDLELVANLSRAVTIPVLAEGRYRTPQQASNALAVGALAVVVGGAITRPQEITRYFIEEIQHTTADTSVSGARS